MNWEAFAAESAAVVREVTTDLRPAIERTARDIARRLRSGRKVLFCGNGGSAADAQHMAGEFVNRFLRERRPYAGLALSTDTSVLTAVANDYRFEDVFAKQVRALGRRGDVLVAFSTSGRARNVLRAVDAARSAGLLTVGITGGAGGPLARRVERCLRVSASRSTPRIQEGHLLILHALCERIEEIAG
jgi:D-sedoheptulose 7-phosphate isomerase